MQLDVEAIRKLPLTEIYRMEAEAREIWEMMVSESGRKPVTFIMRTPSATPFINTFEQFRRAVKNTHNVDMKQLVKGMTVKLDEDI